MRCTDVRLSGGADYDLWCRMAERDWTRQVVPQLLARRRASASSAALSTMNPSAGASVSLLIDAPTLMAGSRPPM
jgi:hypothetical protein